MMGGGRGALPRAAVLRAVRPEVHAPALLLAAAEGALVPRALAPRLLQPGGFVQVPVHRPEQLGRVELLDVLFAQALGWIMVCKF